MQGRLALLLGGAVVAGAAAYRVLTRRAPAPVVPEPHVEALKARLAESKAVAEEREEFEAGETPIDEAEPVPTEVGDRRRSVHGLAESKAVAEEREEFEAGETPIDEAEPVPTEVGDRRRSVHDRGRQVAEQMRRGTSTES